MIKKTSKSKPTIISFILDRSGSMESMKKAVVSGFNEYINGLKKSKDAKNILFSLTTFDTVGIDRPYIATKISQVEPLTSETFQPRGGTPLYDAAVNAIEELAKKVDKDQPTLVVIMTDGEENSSHEHNEKCFSDLVEKLKMRGNWTFVYMGANQDSWGNASNWGYTAQSVQDYAFNEKGIKTAFRNLSMGTENYVMAMASAADSGAQLNSNSNFFTQTAGK